MIRQIGVPGTLFESKGILRSIDPEPPQRVCGVGAEREPS